MAFILSAICSGYLSGFCLSIKALFLLFFGRIDFDSQMMNHREKESI